MKKLTTVAVLMLSAMGCSSAKITESNHVSTKLRDLKTVQLLITVDQAETQPAVRYFRSCLITELCKREMFVKFIESNEPGASDVRMSIALSGLRTTSNLELAAFGECAGRARLTATVTLTDLKSREDIGTFTVHGKSGCYETTYGGIEATAKGLADHLQNKIAISRPE